MYNLPFADLPEKVVCSPEVYDKFAHWLVHTYIIEQGNKNAGEQLKVDSAIPTVSSLINQAAAKYKTSSNAESRLFFLCLDSSSSAESSKWLQGLKTEIRRVVFLRDMKDGATQDESAPPFYITHVREMVRASQVLLHIVDLIT